MTWREFPTDGPGPIKKTGATGLDAIEELAASFEDDGVLAEEKLNTDDRLDNIEDHLRDLTDVMTQLANSVTDLVVDRAAVTSNTPSGRKKATKRKRIGDVRKVLLKD